MEIEVSSSPRWDDASGYKKEMRKWDLPKSRGGMRPDTFQEFPFMMYRARKRQHPDGEPYGPFLVLDASDERFSESNTLIVNSEAERERARHEGWRNTPQEAKEYQEGLEHDIAIAAAEHQARVRKMSPKAQAEAAEADEATTQHVPEIPEKPRARKSKGA